MSHGASAVPRLGLYVLLAGIAYIILSTPGFGLPKHDLASMLLGETQAPKQLDEFPPIWAEGYRIAAIGSSGGRAQMLELALAYQSSDGAVKSINLYGGKIRVGNDQWQISDIPISYGFGGPKASYGALAPGDIAVLKLKLSEPIKGGDDVSISVEPVGAVRTDIRFKAEKIADGDSLIWP